MTKATLTALGAALIALGQELQGECTETAPTPTPAGDPQPTRRGRGPAKTEAPPAGEDKGKPENELRELIKPLIDDGRGDEVKKLITKHGGTKLSDLPAAAHAAFVRDVEALTI